jgi:F0F1-type ATP synthase membrane subunit c/vacuolar-type H+-ATPase subunit K
VAVAALVGATGTAVAIGGVDGVHAVIKSASTIKMLKTQEVFLFILSSCLFLFD